MVKKNLHVMILTVCLGVLFTQQLVCESTENNTNPQKEAVEKLAILWTTSEVEVAKKMIFIYAVNALRNNWFQTVRLITWGPSNRLIHDNESIQSGIKKLREAGVELYACKWCADQYGLSDFLTGLGIEVVYYGESLSRLIKGGWKVLTF